MKKTFSEITQESISNRLITGLAKISLALKTQAWKGANERGLSPTQGQILALLARNTTVGAGQRLNDLAEALAVTAATTSDAVRSLEQKGLLIKTRSSQNARELSITLTEAGRAEAARSAQWPDVLLEAVSTLSGDEQAVFLRALVKMLSSLQEREQIPVSSMCITCRYFRPNAHADSKKPHHCDFVDAAFGDASLQIQCRDHDPATAEQTAQAWQVFTSAR